MIKYVAKKSTWFLENSEVELLVDCRPEMNIGIFKGQRKSEGKPELHPLGDIYIDEEDCSFDEFEVINV